MEEMRVLVVDADEARRSETADLISAEFDVETQTAGSVTAASELIEAEPPTVLITGYNFSEGNGLELVRLLREESPGSGCILYTHSETIDTDTFEDLIVDFVPKETPDATETLLALVEQTGVEQSQAAHPVPESERDRLVAAETVSEMPLIAPFEHISHLALDHFGLEAATITVIHREEQEQLASAGPNLAPTLREQSIGTHVLTAEQQVLGVEDTRTDPRFADINAIHEAGIVSYLGATIHAPDGEAVAVLSVYGTDPRVFDAADREYLGRLATLAEDLLAVKWGDMG